MKESWIAWKEPWDLGLYRDTCQVQGLHGHRNNAYNNALDIWCNNVLDIHRVVWLAERGWSSTLLKWNRDTCWRLILVLLECLLEALALLIPNTRTRRDQVRFSIILLYEQGWSSTLLKRNRAARRRLVLMLLEFSEQDRIWPVLDIRTLKMYV